MPRLHEPDILRSPYSFAEAWYRTADIERHLELQREGKVGHWERVPDDVYSPEFAQWLVGQYQLAMAKGIQLGANAARSVMEREK